MPPGKMEEVLLVVNNATFVNNDNELESLFQPFQSMKHGVKFDLIPHEYGGKASMIMDEEIPFEYDTENYSSKQGNQLNKTWIPCNHWINSTLRI